MIEISVLFQHTLTLARDKMIGLACSHSGHFGSHEGYMGRLWWRADDRRLIRSRGSDQADHFRIGFGGSFGGQEAGVQSRHKNESFLLWWCLWTSLSQRLVDTGAHRRARTNERMTCHWAVVFAEMARTGREYWTNLLFPQTHLSSSSPTCCGRYATVSSYARARVMELWITRLFQREGRCFMTRLCLCQWNRQWANAVWQSHCNGVTVKLLNAQFAH